MSERDAILHRIQRAVGSTRPPAEAPTYSPEPDLDDAGQQDTVTLFAQRVADYRASVHRVLAGELLEKITDVCRSEFVRSLVVPHDVHPDWLPPDVTSKPDSVTHPLSKGELASSDAVLTGCRLGIAQTGTLVLDHGPSQGRRVITLIPDHHLCVVFAHQVVRSVPAAFARLDSLHAAERPPITFISGPSATSDIELNRIEGVHGPRRLDVFVVDQDGAR